MVVAKVLSSKNDELFYTVEKHNNKWMCNCPAFVFRKAQCKHIVATKESLKGSNNPIVTLWVDNI